MVPDEQRLIGPLIKVRRAVHSWIVGVKDAHSLSWDRTTPNSLIRIRLRELLDNTLVEAESFGIHRITRHSSCGSPDHSGYVIEAGPHTISCFMDERFIWSGYQLYQGDRLSMCPCGPGSLRTKHGVIEELVVRSEGATPRHHKPIEALFEIEEPAKAACAKRTRSTIRERLLCAIIALNDGILPQSVDEYVASQALGT